MSSIGGTVAISLAFLFPAAQLVRFLDQIAAAIDPGFSVVGSLHGLVVASPAASAVLLAALVGTAWVACPSRTAETVSARVD